MTWLCKAWDKGKRAWKASGYKLTMENNTLKEIIKLVEPQKKGAANIYIERLGDVKEGCKMTGVSRSKYYYKPKKDSHSDSILLDKIKDIATEYPYYGYRRITASLRRHGHPVNHKKVYRGLWGVMASAAA